MKFYENYGIIMGLNRNLKKPMGWDGKATEMVIPCPTLLWTGLVKLSSQMELFSRVEGI